GAAMRQEQFVARHQAEWEAFEQWLRHRGGGRGKAGPGQPQVVADEEIPARYRRLCQQLALARSRDYSSPLLEHLQQLMQDGHAVLYRAPPPRWRPPLEFVAAGFPRLVRSQATLKWTWLAWSALPVLAMYLLELWRQELISNG